LASSTVHGRRSAAIHGEGRGARRSVAKTARGRHGQLSGERLNRAPLNSKRQHYFETYRPQFKPLV